jgi:hypothetical protein
VWTYVDAVQSCGHRRLLAHRLARRGVEAPITWRRSTGQGLMLVAPPSKLAADLEGAPFLAEALLSV